MPDSPFADWTVRIRTTTSIVAAWMAEAPTSATGSRHIADDGTLLTDGWGISG